MHMMRMRELNFNDIEDVPCINSSSFWEVLVDQPIPIETALGLLPCESSSENQTVSQKWLVGFFSCME